MSDLSSAISHLASVGDPVMRHHFDFCVDGKSSIAVQQVRSTETELYVTFVVTENVMTVNAQHKFATLRYYSFNAERVIGEFGFSIGAKKATILDTGPMDCTKGSQILLCTEVYEIKQVT